MANTPFVRPQMPQALPRMGFMDRIRNNSDLLMMTGAGLLSGRTGPEQFALAMQGASGAANQRKQAQQRNQTVEFLRTVNPQMAAAVEAGAMSPGDAYKAHLTTARAPQGTDDMREYEFARQQGYGGSFMDFMTANRRAGATNVTVDSRGNTLPNPPKDHVWAMNQDGSAQIDERGAPIPIPIGPALQEQQEAQQASAVKAATQSRYGGVVIEDIDRAISQIEQSPRTTTGIGGATLSGVPGTSAHTVAKLLTTVKANAGFDRLQAMRDASPTGGALGQVSERELMFLQSAIGSLEQSQSHDELIYNLQRVRAIYDEIINGPAASRQQAPAPSANAGRRRYNPQTGELE